MGNNYNILANYIVEKYIEQISGANLSDRLVGIEPEKEVMVGMLAEGRVEKTFDGRLVENTEKRFESVPSISLSFKVENSGELHLFIKGLLFYTVMPEFNEIRDYFIEKYSEIDNKDYKSIDDLLVFHEDKKEVIPRVYKKLDLESVFNEGIVISVPDLNEGVGTFDEKIAAILKKEIDSVVMSEISIVRDSSISLSDLKSDKLFYSRCSKKEEIPTPHWKISVHSYVAKSSDGVEISLQLINGTEIEDKKNYGYSPKFFNAGIKVKAKNTKFIPVDMDYSKKNYKQRELVYSFSENASSKFIDSENAIVTENIPIFYQKRLVTNDSYSLYSSFAKLIEDPVYNLNCILDKMRKDYLNCENEFNSVKDSLNDMAAKKYSDDLSDYQIEIDRFEAGIKQIELKDYVKKAFKSMNSTFMLEMPSGYSTGITGWRLFQLVFIVSLIPEMIRSEYPDDNSIREADNVVANLLYFPTGGGKTEAFLGATVFDMFFDRYRGKNDGITSILKYPLRLLAVQQLDRVLTIIMKANVIKNRDPLINKSSDFCVGFFVGKKNTPNKITLQEPLSARADEYNSSKMLILDSDEDTLNDYYRFIDTCPNCRQRTVNMRFNRDKWSLEHVCDNKDCCANVLPI